MTFITHFLYYNTLFIFKNDNCCIKLTLKHNCLLMVTSYRYMNTNLPKCSFKWTFAYTCTNIEHVITYMNGHNALITKMGWFIKSNLFILRWSIVHCQNVYYTILWDVFQNKWRFFSNPVTEGRSWIFVLFYTVILTLDIQ